MKIIDKTRKRITVHEVLWKSLKNNRKNKQNSHDAMKTIEMQQKNITNKHKTKKNSEKTTHKKQQKTIQRL